MRDTAAYEETGIVLSGRRKQDYAADRAVSLIVYRCTLCGALVGDDDWGDDRRVHSAWHESTA